MDILFVMDPLEVLIPETETSRPRGRSRPPGASKLDGARAGSLPRVERVARSRTRAIEVDEKTRPTARLGAEEDELWTASRRPHAEGSPVDIEYLNALLILEPAAQRVP